MRSLKGSELSDVIGRMLWTQKGLPDLLCYAGIDDIETAIKNKVTQPLPSSIVTYKDGFKITFAYLGKLKTAGIAYHNIKSIRYIGGSDLTNTQASMSNAVVTGLLLGPVAGILSAALDSSNKNRLLFAIDTKDGDTAILGIPSYRKSEADKFFKKTLPNPDVFDDSLPS